MKKTTRKANKKITDAAELVWRRFIAGDPKREAYADAEFEKLLAEQKELAESTDGVRGTKERTATIKQVKKFAAEIGGMKALKEIVDSLSK